MNTRILAKGMVAAATLGIGLGLQAMAQAGTIVGGSTLLSGADVTQLETWLGEGPLTLTNIYTKTSGDTALNDFHPAVDGQGRTFTIFEVTAGDNYIYDNGGFAFIGPYSLGRQVIGGYNPQSWRTDNPPTFFNNTPNVADMTAFIFNLTQGLLKEQVNEVQTRNFGFDGPFFGTGQDIQVFNDLSSGLATSFTYCDPGTTTKGADATVFGCSPVFGQTPQNNVLGATVNTSDLVIGALEVFTIAAVSTQQDPTPPGQGTNPTTSIPEPGTLLLWGLGLGCLALGQRRRPN